MSHGLSAQARKGHDGKVGDKEVKGEQWMALQEWALFLGSPIHKHSQPGGQKSSRGSQPLSSAPCQHVHEVYEWCGYGHG